MWFSKRKSPKATEPTSWTNSPDLIATQALKLAKAGTWEWDIKKNAGRWSKETYGIYNIDPSKTITYEEILELIHPDDRDYHQLLTQECIESKHKKVSYEYRIILKDSSTRYLQSFGEVMCDPQGKPMIIRGLVQDITERKLAEVELAQREATLDAIFNGITDAIVYTDINRKIIACNRGTKKIFGFSENELLGKTTSVLYECEDEYLKQEKLRFNLTSEEKEALYVVNYCRKNGDTFPGETLGTVIKGVEDEVLGYIGVMRDITERRKAESALLRSDEQFREVLENSRDLSYKYDLKAREYNYISMASKSVLGFSPAECHTMGFEGAIRRLHPEDTQHYSQQFQALHSKTAYLLKDNIPILEYRWKHRNDSYHWYSDNQTLIFNEDKEPIAIIGSVRDITSAKLAEQRLLEKEDALQKMQELENIGVLAGGIAHDFNNILTGLFGNISLAKKKMGIEHPSYSFLKKSEMSMDRATSLTQQLLTFAKGGDPIREGIHLPELIQETTEFDLSGSNVKAIFDFSDELWEVNADRGQVQQVISNLIINADQAMPEGGHLFLSLENIRINDNHTPGLKIGKYVKLILKDEGVGIDKQFIDRIFDPYFSTKKSGSGLGLATAYSIIKRHAGYLGVNSIEGEGTIFSIYLPASDSLTSSSIEPEKKQIPENKNLKVLIMDDDEAILSLVSSILELNEMKVDTVLNGKQAIERYQQAIDDKEPFDVVIMDLTIPGGMGGKEAVVEILNINPEANCIVSSGYADDPIIANYEEYGFKGVITKPFLMDDVMNALSIFE